MSSPEEETHTSPNPFALLCQGGETFQKIAANLNSEKDLAHQNDEAETKSIEGEDMSVEEGQTMDCKLKFVMKLVLSRMDLAGNDDVHSPTRSGIVNEVLDEHYDTSVKHIEDKDAFKDTFQLVLAEVLWKLKASLPSSLNPDVHHSTSSNGSALKETGVSTGDSSVALFRYLMACYSRMSDFVVTAAVGSFEKDCIKSSLPIVIDNILLLLRPSRLISSSRENLYAVLINSIFSHYVSTSFLTDLATQVLQRGTDDFNKVFWPLFDALLRTAIASSLSSDDARRPIMVLGELCDLKIGSQRPFCTSLCSRPDWLPECLSAAKGREICRTSYLGPFLCISAFPSDDCRVYRSLPMEEMTEEDFQPTFMTFRNRLESLRLAAFSICHNLLVNADSRILAMNYFQVSIEANSKSSNMLVIN
ncbi:unnamed protein product [Soboliphyme baturini]|uniref:Ufd2P_core domain-containing protein n=1 Tax=Soboliphyme baturini TaxID=241478 RepID=A0A183IJU4_9BILA|nr:unnamed protein product [Soboliphyme baturini]